MMVSHHSPERKGLNEKATLILNVSMIRVLSRDEADIKWVKDNFKRMRCFRPLSKYEGFFYLTTPSS
jgi:hypothetical protein